MAKKHIRIINNPSSGNKMMQRILDQVCITLLNKGYTISKYSTEKKGDAFKEASCSKDKDVDFLIVCGGDGTVNEVAGGMASAKCKIPFAICPGGTVNDLAGILNIPDESVDFCEMIENEKIIDIDLGMCNDHYFINVAAFGLLTNVAHSVSHEHKANFGPLAYYLTGLQELASQSYRPIPVCISSEEYSAEEEIVLFLICNSSSIGGFKKMAPLAQINDGLFDCLLVRKLDIQDIIGLFFSFINGEHINHPSVHYFKTGKITIESDNKDISLDVDGEYAGSLPATCKILKSALSIFVPADKKKR